MKSMKYSELGKVSMGTTLICVDIYLKKVIWLVKGLILVWKDNIILKN